MNENQFNRLPKYARDEISRLRSNLAIAERKVREVFGDMDTDTKVLGYVNPDLPLPNHSTVCFTFGNGRCIEVRGGEFLSVNGGMGSIEIEPRASNSCHIRCK